MDSLKQPTHLRVNLLTQAYNVVQDPKFSWWVESTANDTFQTAYQLVFGTSKQALADHNYLAVSPWETSGENTAVAYPALNDLLIENKIYYWQVRIRDNHGHTSELSKPNHFLTAIDHFQAPGIWAASQTAAPDGRPALGNFAFLRSPQFKLPAAKIDSVYIRVLARGNEVTLAQSFDLYVNGHCVGVGSARPHEYYDDQDQTAYFYQTFDISHQVQPQDNQISVLATGASELRAFFAQVVAFESDGTPVELLVSDASWRALDGSSAFGDFGAKIASQYFEMPQENVDMNFYPQGFFEPSFADGTWPAAAVTAPTVPLDGGLLLPYGAENTQRFKTAEPTKVVTKLAPTTYLVDLGKEIIGSLTVALTSPVAQKVNIYAGEQLQADGHVRHHLACGPDYVETWQLVAGDNRFTTLQMKNFRYVEVVGFQGDLPVDAISGWAERQAFDDQLGTFESDQPLLNQEYDLSKYTIKATNQDIYVDSQARERRAYEGDLLVNANSSYVISDNYALARHSANYLLDNPTWPEDYKLFNVEMLWYDYLYTGDATLLAARYDVIKEKLKRGATKTDNANASWRPAKQADNYDENLHLVTNNGLIDWPIRERDGYVEGTYNTPFNAIYVGVYQIMAQIADVVGQKADQALYAKRSADLKAAMIARLYDPKAGKFYDSLQADLTPNTHFSHHASAYALCYGVYDSPAMADQLAKFVANDGEFIGSIYFIYFMLRGLLNSGHAKAASRLLLNGDDQKDAKTFAAILNQLKATIAPEAWSNYYKPNLTLSHPWGATPGLTIVQGIAGIMPLEPAFKRFSVRVQAGEVKRFTLQTPCCKGLIQLNYQHLDTTETLTLTVPANTTAVVTLPDTAQAVTVDDQAQALTKNALNLTSGQHLIRYQL
ncbi:MAG: family 78 glycoside hydrolase catalytic domain [Lactobacillus sp.]|nr:family 78 glycoside hydrolase catalytic domain [Lactobacillus sp.]